MTALLPRFAADPVQQAADRVLVLIRQRAELASAWEREGSSRWQRGRTGFMAYPMDADEFGRLMYAVSIPLTREAERSLWLNRVVAVRIAEDPDRAIAIAQGNLDRMEAVQPVLNPWLRAWRSLLDAGVDVVLGVLTSRDPEAVELRQNSPFAGVLGYREREQVLESFRRHWSRAHSRTETAAP